MRIPKKTIEFPKFDLDYLRDVLPRMSDERFTEVLGKYRTYLAVGKAYPKVSHTPSVDVDMVWSAHRVDAARYEAHCMEFFGTHAKHTPMAGCHHDR